jgi:hypothetical protein
VSLDLLIGEWVTEATFPDGMSGTGRTTFAWALGGAFLLQRVTTDGDGPPEGLCLIGVDGDDFVQHYFDSRGVVRRYAMTFTSEAWTLERDGVQRFHGRIEGETIRGAWEWHRDGAWQHDFDLVYRRSVAP